MNFFYAVLFKGMSLKTQNYRANSDLDSNDKFSGCAYNSLPDYALLVQLEINSFYCWVLGFGNDFLHDIHIERRRKVI